jgi:hypothetical protein
VPASRVTSNARLPSIREVRPVPRAGTDSADADHRTEHVINPRMQQPGVMLLLGNTFCMTRNASRFAHCGETTHPRVQPGFIPPTDIRANESPLQCRRINHGRKRDAVLTRVCRAASVCAPETLRQDFAVCVADAWRRIVLAQGAVAEWIEIHDAREVCTAACGSRPRQA